MEGTLTNCFEDFFSEVKVAVDKTDMTMFAPEDEVNDQLEEVIGIVEDEDTKALLVLGRKSDAEAIGLAMSGCNEGVQAKVDELMHKAAVFFGFFTIAVKSQFGLWGKEVFIKKDWRVVVLRTQNEIEIHKIQQRIEGLEEELDRRQRLLSR